MTSEEPMQVEAAAAAAVVDDNDAQNESALHNNIRVKGKNSYYYAHKPRDGAHLTWDGKQEPRLLKKEEKSRAVPVVGIKSYAWSDGTKKVSIYVNLAGIGHHPDDLIDFQWGTESISLKVDEFGGKSHVLKMNLYEAIEDATMKKKDDKLVLSLKKVKEFSWHSLMKDK